MTPTGVRLLHTCAALSVSFVGLPVVGSPGSDSRVRMRATDDAPGQAQPQLQFPLAPFARKRESGQGRGTCVKSPPKVALVAKRQSVCRGRIYLAFPLIGMPAPTFLTQRQQQKCRDTR
jgi:hypothetical protein